MSLKSNTRNVFLDIFKFFLCYLVIAIHLLGETYAEFPVYRLAVPMFFIISGYFNDTKDSSRRKEKAKGFIVRTAKYMLTGFLIYIIFDFIMCYVDGHGVGYYFTTLFYEDFLLEFLIMNRPITYTGAQLWFLIALFVVSLIHYVLVRFDKLHYYKIIIPVCYLIYFFFAGYMYLLQNTDMPIRYTRNALFFGLPNFALGYTLARFDFHKKPWYKYIYLTIGVLCFFLQIKEYALVKSENCSLEMYVTSVLCAVFLLEFFLGIKRCGCDFYYKWIGKNASFYIYILHMAVAVVLGKLVTFENQKLRCLAVLVVSFMIYEAVYLLSLAIKKAKRVDS
ncbi:MAG: acyltransferase [Clostridia bacterium]|nr:acyltransferase [Clostridia bacterium]